MDKELIARKQTFAGLFMVTLATLMYEILLTRIFSVTMWYHFAFMAISIALFGMTVGAIIVYLLPSFFTDEKVRYQLSLSSIMFAVTIVVSFFIHLNIPTIGFTENISKRNLLFLSINYIVITIPFLFSGVSVCLALTKFPGQISKLYAIDLAGAAAGCIVLIYTLNITDGPTAVIIVAFFACCGAAFFAYEGGFKTLLRTSLIIACLFASFTITNTFLVHNQHPLIRLKWLKGIRERPPLYEKWNSFSRITVSGKAPEIVIPPGTGISPSYPFDQKIRWYEMSIDKSAGTALTAFDGNLNKLKHVKYDITNVVHYIRKNAKVLIIGTGRGIDILSALAFGQKSILGVEINKDIIETVNNRFGDFTGHLDKFPNITFINDEARSYITRQKDKFDIIEASMIDTWAATASGAFVLTENSLYTVEAWKLFLEHLTPNGILTFSRWYYKDRPGEVYRLTSLARESLLQVGIKNPRDHIIILKVTILPPYGYLGKTLDLPGVGTILVSKEPFSSTDIGLLEAVAKKMQFDIVLSPRYALDSTFETIASGSNIDKLLETFPINISAPSDDSPFFFNMLRLRDMFKRELWNQEVINLNLKAVFVLGILLITVIGLTLLCIIAPLILTAKKAVTNTTLPLFIYFASIGFGFILIEISQMQRLIVFLGHPTYGLSVVLFSLLLSSGIGSYATQHITNTLKIKLDIILLSIFLCVLITFGILTPTVIREFQGSITVIRICAAAAILSILGLFMGMAFPLGMKMASIRSSSLTPWLWGINGATSVCASVLAIAIAVSSSISTSFWVGFIFYTVAFCAFIWASQKKDFCSKIG